MDLSKWLKTGNVRPFPLLSTLHGIKTPLTICNKRILTNSSCLCAETLELKAKATNSTSNKGETTSKPTTTAKSTASGTFLL